MSDDLTPTVRIPGPSEIVGFVAAGLPFLLSTATSSSSTVNGEVVTFVYRDWTAVGGGTVALVCGVISLLLLRRRTTNKPARIAIAVGLLALGSFHVARGFGVMAGGPASSSTTMTITTRSPEPAYEVPAVDLDKPAQAFAERWAAGKLDEIYRDAHYKLREVVKLAELKRMHVLLDKGFGKLTKLGTLSQKYADAKFVVTAPAVFEQGELSLRLDYALVGDAPKLIAFNFEIPKALQRAGKFDDADQLAAKFLEDLLAGKLDRSVLDPRVISNLSPTVEAELEATRKDMGKSKSKLEVPNKQNVVPCDNEDNRCLQFNLRGARSARFRIELEYGVRSWLVVSFDLRTNPE